MQGTVLFRAIVCCLGLLVCARPLTAQTRAPQPNAASSPVVEGEQIVLTLDKHNYAQWENVVLNIQIENSTDKHRCC